MTTLISTRVTELLGVGLKRIAKFHVKVGIEHFGTDYPSFHLSVWKFLKALKILS